MMAKDLLGDLPEPDIESGETAQPHVPPIDATPASTASTALVPPPMANTVPPDNTASLAVGTIPPASTTDIMQLMGRAIDKNADPVTMQGMYDLYKEIKRDEAEMAFTRAFADFQKDCPMLFVKDKHIDTTTTRGAKFGFDYTSREAVSKVVIPLLRKHGFTTAFSAAPVPGTQMMHIQCTLSHTGGHSVDRGSVLPMSGTDAVEQMKSMTRGERKALFMALGIASGDSDLGTDGDGDADPTPPEDLIRPEDVDTIEHLLQKKGLSDGIGLGQFLDWVGVPTVKAIPNDKYDSVIEKLKSKPDSRGPS